MIKVKATKIIVIFGLICCLLSSTRSQDVNKTQIIDCPWVLDRETSCFSYFPDCEKVNVTFVPAEKKTYYFCLKCRDDFKLRTKSTPQDNTDKLYPFEPLLLCDREGFEGVKKAQHWGTTSELGGCLEYSIKRNETNKEGRGFFTCNKCAGDLEPIDIALEAPLSPMTTKELCWPKLSKPIKVGGTYLESQYPGCDKIMVLTRTINFNKKDQNDPVTIMGYAMCVTAKPGYKPTLIAKYRNLQRDKPSASPAEPLMTASNISCLTPECQKIFPRCYKFKWTTEYKEKESKTTFSCSECAPGYEPLSQTLEKGFADLLAYSGPPLLYDICRIKEIEKKTVQTDVEKSEYPGCQEYSIKNVAQTVNKNNHIGADIKCISCMEGYEKIPGVEKKTTDGYLQFYGKRLYRPKYFCRPLIKEGTIKCDAKCKKEFPFCDAYTFSRVSPIDDEFDGVLVQYKCSKCQDGYDSHIPMKWSHYFNDPNQKNVCQPNETKPADSSAACDAKCQQTFPKCKKIKIKFEVDKDRDWPTYTCEECEKGFFPVVYNTTEPTLNAKTHGDMLTFPIIALCLPKQDSTITRVDSCWNQKKISPKLFRSTVGPCKLPAKSTDKKCYYYAEYFTKTVEFREHTGICLAYEEDVFPKPDQEIIPDDDSDFEEPEALTE